MDDDSSSFLKESTLESINIVGVGLGCPPGWDSAVPGVGTCESFGVGLCCPISGGWDSVVLSTWDSVVLSGKLYRQAFPFSPSLQM